MGGGIAELFLKRNYYRSFLSKLKNIKKLNATSASEAGSSVIPIINKWQIYAIR